MAERARPITADMSTDVLTPLGDLTGAELFIFEAEAAEHGTPDELDAAREEIARRIRALAATTV